MGEKKRESVCERERERDRDSERERERDIEKLMAPSPTIFKGSPK
jgi:hypothetical protein